MLKSDEDFVIKAQSNDNEACEQILEKYKPMVLCISRAYFLLGGDKDDLVQEGMIGLYKAIISYSTEKAATFSTYANVCIRRQLCTAIKNASRKKHMPLNDYVSLSSFSGDENDDFSGFITMNLMNPEEIVISKERIEALYGSIDQKLSKLEKDVLFEFLKGRPYDKIAAKIGKESKAVDNALQRIRKKLKEEKI